MTDQRKSNRLHDLVVAIDFDGTCVTHEYPKVGRSIGAERVLTELTNQGARLILWTMRSGERLSESIRWFEEREIPLWGINENPEQKTWTTSPKVYANIYIDDAAFGAPLRQGFSGERLYIDWEEVRKILVYRNILVGD